MLTGVERIRAAFDHAAGTQSAALMPYFTLGYPDREQSLAAIEAIAPYSDLLELGVPFSDPIADGPTIQRSTQKSLAAGTSVAGCLDMLHTLRARGVSTPALLMGYINPILAYGQARFVAAAAAAGAAGLLVPDLPPEEAQELEQLCRQHGLAYIFFLAPTSDAQRIATISERASGFVYMVSLTGVTGARRALGEGLAATVSQLRETIDVPIALGFGISTARQAAAAAAFADGVIVGSALIDHFDRDGIQGATSFIQSLQQALRVKR